MRTIRRLMGWISCLILASCGREPRPNGPHPPQVTVKGRKIEVRVVATRAARKAFTPGSPALIVHARPRFHHYETDAAEVAFLDVVGRVVDVQTIEQDRPGGITSEVEACYALFMPVGTGLTEGETVALDETIPKVVAEELHLVKVNAISVAVERAATHNERTHGLMWRTRMSKDDGMLFIYPDSETRGFWMGHCYIDLDIAFFREDGSLINVVEMKKYPDPDVDPGDRARSEDPAMYVLETNIGWFRARGLTDEKGQPQQPVYLTIPEGDDR